jgi:hypothetical protein
MKDSSICSTEADHKRTSVQVLGKRAYYRPGTRALCRYKGLSDADAVCAESSAGYGPCDR